MRQWKELPRDQLALILGTLHEKTSMVEKYVHLPTFNRIDIESFDEPTRANFFFNVCVSSCTKIVVHAYLLAFYSERALWKRKDRMQQEELNILRISLEKSEQKVRAILIMLVRKADAPRL